MLYKQKGLIYAPKDVDPLYEMFSSFILHRLFFEPLATSISWWSSACSPLRCFPFPLPAASENCIGKCPLNRPIRALRFDFVSGLSSMSSRPDLAVELSP